MLFDFIHQFQPVERVKVVRRKPSITIPHQSFTVSEILKRFASGNQIGIEQHEVVYSSDDPNFDEKMDYIGIDRSDPLTDIHYKQAYIEDIAKIVNDAKSKVMAVEPVV
ncbi:MAG: hypothetical protein [Microvirus sp.]|nr:MAG: hypothetical protein [Microvirus sp.]